MGNWYSRKATVCDITASSRREAVGKKNWPSLAETVRAGAIGLLNLW
nr:MAG TPA: hypothetical protein [Caudoviricetes sp.]